MPRRSVAPEESLLQFENGDVEEEEEQSEQEERNGEEEEHVAGDVFYDAKTIGLRHRFVVGEQQKFDNGNQDDDYDDDEEDEKAVKGGENERGDRLYGGEGIQTEDEGRKGTPFFGDSNMNEYLHLSSEEGMERIGRVVNVAVAILVGLVFIGIVTHLVVRRISEMDKERERGIVWTGSLDVVVPYPIHVQDGGKTDLCQWISNASKAASQSSARAKLDRDFTASWLTALHRCSAVSGGGMVCLNYSSVRSSLSSLLAKTGLASTALLMSPVSLPPACWCQDNPYGLIWNPVLKWADSSNAEILEVLPTSLVGKETAVSRIVPASALISGMSESGQNVVVDVSGAQVACLSWCLEILSCSQYEEHFLTKPGGAKG